MGEVGRLAFESAAWSWDRGSLLWGCSHHRGGDLLPRTPRQPQIAVCKCSLPVLSILVKNVLFILLLVARSRFSSRCVSCHPKTHLKGDV